MAPRYGTAFVLWIAVPAAAERSPTSAPSAQTESDAPKPSRPVYSNSLAIGTRVSPDPPEYVRSGAQIAEWLRDPRPERFNWLEFGIEHNTRFEHRQNFYPAGNLNDDRFLMRSRAYLGLREILDPLRFGLEFQDARAFGNSFPEVTRDLDENEILQAFTEVYLKDVLGREHPLSLRAGRMSFDLVNRRLFARNAFRNSTNSFDGFRLRAGDATTPWEVNLLAVQPVAERVRQFNRCDERGWLYALSADLRWLDPGIRFLPYYIVRHADGRDRTVADQEFHTIGHNVFGRIGASGFDYDLDAAWQFGERRQREVRAFALHAELGYSFELARQPRIAAFVDYASGDRHPRDRIDERFDRLFGAAHTMYAPTDMFIRENLIQPGLRFTWRPIDKLTIESTYRAYWLASDSDEWRPTGIRDPNGRSGDFIGHGLDVFAVYRLSRQITIEIGYAHLTAGPFIQNAASRADDSDFFYVQTTLRL